ncbi:ATP-binding protein [Kordiimonas sp. SCSIO 12610]|uniref:ATP-binding protein n=1 Tax=Kordiimonas sp. SCSIO 12610 TaxID=2829597 RepID=UPI00210DCF00|nr:ATP-binding protein [Kordiimonas sp. SCSIO 12610]UTW56729.1 ATP-binding protein [Kordiimonas sp. SCSIO 12610]
MSGDDLLISNSSKASVAAITNCPVHGEKLLGLSCHDFEIVICASFEEVAKLFHSPNSELTMIIIAADVTTELAVDYLNRFQNTPDYQNLPVIVIRPEDNDDDELELLSNGALQIIDEAIAYTDTMTNNVIRIIKKSSKLIELEGAISRHKCATSNISYARFKFKTREEANNIALLLSNNMAQPTLAYTGLLELLLNAVEHGLYGFGTERKSKLINACQFEEEVSKQKAIVSEDNRFVSLEFQKTDEDYRFIILDDGDGFDFTRMETVDTANIDRKNGRGVMMAKHCFDSLQYSEGGRCVTATISL